MANDKQAEKAAKEIMQPYWQDTRTMDYWQEVERIAAIIERQYPRLVKR